jgi:hypothetical protein
VESKNVIKSLLISEKKIVVKESTNIPLSSMLKIASNVFNTKYENISEEEKNELKSLLSLSKKETDMLRFANRLEELADGDDQRKIENEKIFIQRRIDELQSEIFQLENNIQFFSNQTKENPFLKEVKKNIERHKEDLNVWRDKLKQLKNL